MPLAEHQFETDREVMVRVQAGDRTALSALYQRHILYLRTVAARFVRDEGLVEDVVHEVFIEVWQRAGTYRPERACVRSWIAMRVRSRCLDRLRSREAYARFLEGASHAERSSVRESADTQIDGRRAALVASTALPEPQRLILEMGYFDGLTYPEVARALGIPLGTVKSRMRAALRTLRAHFDARLLQGG